MGAATVQCDLTFFRIILCFRTPAFQNWTGRDFPDEIIPQEKNVAVNF